MNESGVYCIKNTVDGNRYVGATIHLPDRRSVHFSHLRAGRHHSKLLQAAFDANGEAAFVVETLEECSPDLLTDREAAWVSRLKPAYNTGQAGSGGFHVRGSPVQGDSGVRLRAFLDTPRRHSNHST